MVYPPPEVEILLDNALQWYWNDALIHQTAANQGLPVITAYRNDFDLIQQIAAGGTFHYF
jgi:hypothetical protein